MTTLECSVRIAVITLSHSLYPASTNIICAAVISSFERRIGLDINASSYNSGNIEVASVIQKAPILHDVLCGVRQQYFIPAKIYLSLRLRLIFLMGFFEEPCFES